jgi:membrane protease YdiL (CAAX protease family)
MVAKAELIAAAVLLVGCIAAWSVLLWRRSMGGSLVEYEPRRPVPWDLPVVAPAIVLFLGIRIGFVFWAQQHVAADVALNERLQQTGDPLSAWGEPDYARPMFQAAAASQFVTAIVIALVLAIVFRANRNDMGFSARRWAYDLRLGVIGFFALAVPALLLQGALQSLIVESQHPIVLAFKNSTDGSAFLWAAVAAVVVAPTVEEFLFRCVLQGMFERIWSEPSPAIIVNQAEALPPVAAEPQSVAPIFFSAGIFALMHLTSGIDVIPLFFLALGLGYLYRQTHRLAPGIVVHTLLNAFSMVVLLMQTK